MAVEGATKPYNPLTLQVTPEKMMITSDGHLDVQIKNPTDVRFSATISLDSFALLIARAWYIQKDGKEVDEEFTAVKCSHEFTPDKNTFNFRIAIDEKLDPTDRKDATFKNVEGSFSISVCHDPNSQSQKEPNRNFQFQANKTFELSIGFENETTLKLKHLLSEFQKNPKRRERIKLIISEGNEIDLISNDYESETTVWGRSESGKLVDKVNEDVFKKIWKTMDSLTDEEIKKIKWEEHGGPERKKREEEEERKNKKAREDELKNKKKKKKCAIM